MAASFRKHFLMLAKENRKPLVAVFGKRFIRNNEIDPYGIREIHGVREMWLRHVKCAATHQGIYFISRRANARHFMTCERVISRFAQAKHFIKKAPTVVGAFSIPFARQETLAPRLLPQHR